MTTAAEIGEWYDRGVAAGATHMLVVCDDFNYEDYPVYVAPASKADQIKAADGMLFVGEVLFQHSEVREAITTYENWSMQRIMEVYCLWKTPAMGWANHKEFQLGLVRAYDTDVHAVPAGTTVLSCGCGIPWENVHGDRRYGFRNAAPVICKLHGLTAVQELR